MPIIYSDNSKFIDLTKLKSHDPESKTYYSLIYRPEYWNPSSDYTASHDVVIPTYPNGCMYECVSGGTSSLTEPSWKTLEGKKTVDGDVSWRCKPFIALLGYNDLITESIWFAEDGVELFSGIIHLGMATSIRVDKVPDKNSFYITNRITIRRNTLVEEVFDKTLIIAIKDT